MKFFCKIFLPAVIFSSVLVWNLSGATSKIENHNLFLGDTLKADTLKTFNQDSVNAVNIAKGKTLYRGKCQKCHTLYNPKDFTIKVWKKNLKEMKFKAELNKEEYDLIMQYLTENAGK
jgi:hypothetical protein